MEVPKKASRPKTVEEKTNYVKFAEKWGLERIDERMLSKIEELTSQKPHRWLRRGLYFSHRDLWRILEEYEKGTSTEPFYMFTGISPARLHLGHVIPFLFTKHLQDIFKCPVIIQIADAEKFYKMIDPDYTFDDAIRAMYDTVRDIIALGFDPERTYIYSDLLSSHHMMRVITKVRKTLKFHSLKKVFGFNDSDTLGKITFPPTQISSCFSESFEGVIAKPSRPSIPVIPDEEDEGEVEEAVRREKKRRKKKNKTPEGMLCLIPAQIDQDPYFRLTRDIASRLGYHKPCVIYSKFVVGLQGPRSLMSWRNRRSSIFMDDTPKVIKRKINRYAYSGGGETLEIHRKNGADLEVDVSYRYLKLFLESDDELEEIGRKYSSGEMMTCEVKKILITLIQEFVGDFQKKRNEVSREEIKKFMSIRRLKTN